MISVYPRRALAGLTLVAATAAAVLAGAPSALAAPENAPPDTPYQPTVVDGEAQATLDPNDVTKSEIWIKTSVDTDHDGAPDELYAVLQVPNVAKDGAKVPTVIAASPYYGGIKAVPQHDPYRELWDPSQPVPEPAFGTWNRPGDADSDYPSPRGTYWLSRGFAFMAVSTLGTNLSSGCPQMLNRDEAEANKAVIQWLTGEAGVTARDASGNPVTAADWSAGKVGMTGTSYDGALPLLTATTGVEGLEAIAPMAPVSNFYDYYHVAGGMYGPQGYQGEDLDNYVLALLTDDQDIATCTGTAQEFVEQENRASGDYNDFWDERNLLNWTGNVHAATLIGHGMGDLNVRVSQSTDWYQALRAQGTPARLYLHQLEHVNLANIETYLTYCRDDADSCYAGVDPEKAAALGDDIPSSGWQPNLNRWFTHYLFGVENGVENDLGARVQREDYSWIDEPDGWPSTGAGEVSLYPTAGGDGLGGLEAEVRTGAVETTTFADDSTISLQTLVDASSSPNRLVYQSAPLATDLRLSGTASATLGVAIDRPAANITMAIADRAPDGTSHIIARAWTDPQNRTDIRTTEAVVPGTPYDLSLAFVPTDYLIPAGHSLALLVASSDTETSLLPPTSTALTVDTSVTSITLPVVGATDASRAALGAPGTPAIAAASASVVEGDAQTITGTGLAPNADLVLGVDGASEPIAVRTGADGTFALPLPAGATSVTGTRAVTLTAGRATIAGTSFEVVPKAVEPTPSPSPTPMPTPSGTQAPGGGPSDPSGSGPGTGALPATGGEIGAAWIVGLALFAGGLTATAFAARRRKNRA
ncbi:X-Pro dipeptidyl-peptidase [Microbacterium resistens]|uniref:Xaa-Pro dipeptidyl-peptidase n=1 Tax=Microbacterium resistens TaxID=156977 RepID=A0ABU1SH94_9MICO|nr:CocE/NonD family hydrolase [Microbacterium resistens]MDR6868965.1 X-Pro dipeptidyl-peptidase [Microbacterium resistens]